MAYVFRVDVHAMPVSQLTCKLPNRAYLAAHPIYCYKDIKRSLARV